MTNVQEALKAAEKLIVKAIMFESEAEQYLSESNYELNGCLGDSAADISVNGKAVLAKVRAALAEVESRSQPVAWIDPADGALYHYKMYDTYKPLYTAPISKED